MALRGLAILWVCAKKVVTWKNRFHVLLTDGALSEPPRVFFCCFFFSGCSQSPEIRAVFDRTKSEGCFRLQTGKPGSVCSLLSGVGFSEMQSADGTRLNIKENQMNAKSYCSKLLSTETSEDTCPFEMSPF